MRKLSEFRRHLSYFHQEMSYNERIKTKERDSALIRRMKSFFVNKTIKQRFQLWIGTVIVALGFAIILSFYFTEKQDRLSEARSQLKQIAAFQSLYIEQWSRERMDTIKRFALSDNARNNRIAQLNNEILAYARVHTDFENIAYVDKDGFFRSMANPGQSIYLGDREYFAAAVENKDFITGVLKSKSDGKDIITFSSPVLDANGKFAGAIIGTVTIELLDTLMKQLSFGRTGEVYILDNRSRIVTTSETNKAETNLLMDTELLRQAQNNGQVTEAYTGFHGKKVYGQYQWTPGKNWIVVSEITENEVFENLIQLLITVICITLIALVLSFAATVSVVSRLERPIGYLLKGTKIIQNGNYDYYINPDNIKEAPIELRQLCNTYNLMASKLKANITLLEHSALVDQLTEIFNRRYMMLEGGNRLSACIASGQNCSAIMIDIDHFKKINDTHGHPVGDRVLRHVALLLSRYAGNDTIVARYGGEEFIVLALNQNTEDSRKLAESLRMRIMNEPYEEDRLIVPITASMGIAGYAAQPETALAALEDMVARADHALYRAKAGGRNRVELAL